MNVPTEAHQEKSVSEAVIDLERAYVLQNYSRYPLVLRRGKGCYLYDYAGKRYLDLISGIGVNGLGHAHPRILRVMREQAAQLIHCSNLYYHEYQGRLARKLAELSGLQRTFFSNSGTEAIEGAIKIVRAHGHRIGADKYEIVALENSFHGRTTGALAITGQPKYRKDFEPLMPGAKFVPFGDPAALEAAVNERTAGIVIEAIQGEGGVYPAGEGYLRKARELADRHNALLVFDEIQSGVGRPGTPFAYQLFDPVILPDVMTIAKPMACGLPLGAIVMNEKSAAVLGPGMHGSTFGGGALACRVALEFFEMLDELLPHIRKVGDYFKAELRTLGRSFSFVKDVRGHGLMLGIELDFPCKDLVGAAQKEGLLINCTHDTVLRFLPPYIIHEKQVDAAIRILRKVLKKAK
ncbi:MAG: aspartate aminotransferase family protein [Bryobacteraceae bacterium]